MSSQEPEDWELGTECRAEASVHESVVPKFGRANGKGCVGGERGVCFTHWAFSSSSSPSYNYTLLNKGKEMAAGASALFQAL